MNARETSWRMFAGEINSSNFEKKGDDEKSPTYVITPLGTMVNRVLIAGTLTELENSGTEDEPMWKGKIEDISGNYYISAGRYQPEAAASLASMEPSVRIATIAKVRTFTTNDGRTFVSLRPERIIEIDEDKYRLWVLEAAQSMWTRLLKMREACKVSDMNESDLMAKGMTKEEANGILIALEVYGTPDSTRYLKLLQNSLRTLLPNDDIDFGIPGDSSSIPDDMDDEESSVAQKSNSSSDGDKEDIILRLLDEMDIDPHGAPMDELSSRAEMEGITATEVETICNSLMDKGLVYEPNLGYLKKI